MPNRYNQGYPQYKISFGGPMTSAVKGIIILNVIVFLAELLVINAGGARGFGAMLDVLALSPSSVFQRFFIWQLVTYMFLHDPSGVWHILFNMLILWMFGSDIERVWGPRRFLRYYLITGIGAALMNCLFKQPETIGASGAVFGVIVAFAMIFPNRTILFMFIFPLKARQFALLLAAMELYNLGAFTSDGVARIAHLGGALTGYMMLKGFWSPRRIWDDVKWRMRRRRFTTISREKERSDKDRFYPFH